MNGNLKGMMKIAVTGGAASGKSLVCRHLAGRGIPVIILDDVSKALMRKGTRVFEQVVSHFGQDVVAADGSLDRQELRKRITRDLHDKEALEGIVQPAILDEMNRQIQCHHDCGKNLVVVEVPLLFELGMEKAFDRHILVAVSEEIQVKRLMQRDSVCEDDARRLLGLQMPLKEKMKKADIVIDNRGSCETLVDEVDRLFANIFNK